MLAREAPAQMRVTEADVFDCGLSTHADKKRSGVSAATARRPVATPR